tara:strand:+ start:373 stop:1101 length:729 start_codon:yes stop_codon:yes gene_type:complete
MPSEIHQLFKDPIFMPNNLDAVIRASGMNKKQLAKAAGIMPETLSRHIHGKVQMTLENAERYAQILGVSVQKVMFVNPATPIVGSAHLKDNEITRTFYNKWTQGVQIPTYLGDDLCAIKYTSEKGYDGHWADYKDSICFYLKDPIVNHYVHEACIKHHCLAMLEDEIKLPHQSSTRIIASVLYPEPGDVYTIHSPFNGVHFRGVKVKWATPYVSALVRPDLRGATLVDIESEHSDCKDCSSS